MPTSSSSARIHPRNRPAAGWRGVAGLGRHDPDLIVVAKGNEAREPGAFCPDRDTNNNPVGWHGRQIWRPSRLLDVVSTLSTFNTGLPVPTLRTHWFTAHKFGMCVALSAA
jgi:hypothetical protein